MTEIPVEILCINSHGVPKTETICGTFPYSEENNLGVIANDKDGPVVALPVGHGRCCFSGDVIANGATGIEESYPFG
jgi:hypothetical protein